MTIDRAHISALNSTLYRADTLKAQIGRLAEKIADLDNCRDLDEDPRVDRVTVTDKVPEKSAFGRLFSSQDPVTGQVETNPTSGAPCSVNLETRNGFLKRARFQLSTSVDGAQTFSMTQLHPIGEELLQSYTFLPNGTIVVNSDSER